jgi:hypothetical protein
MSELNNSAAIPAGAGQMQSPTCGNCICSVPIVGADRALDEDRRICIWEPPDTNIITKSKAGKAHQDSVTSPRVVRTGDVCFQHPVLKANYTVNLQGHINEFMARSRAAAEALAAKDAAAAKPVDEPAV